MLGSVSAEAQMYEPPALPMSSMYDSPPRKVTKRIDLRVSIETKLNLKAIVRIWKLWARARGDDEAEIDEPFVIRRMLDVGCAQALGDLGLTRRPNTTEEWDKIDGLVKQQVSDVLIKRSEEELAALEEQLKESKTKKK